MHNPDGNPAEQFQTHGFDARTFEIYLQAMLVDEGHAIDRSHERPDFIVDKDGFRAAIEATTANPPTDGTYRPYFAVDRKRRTHAGAVHHIRNEFAARVGSPPFSKLKRRDWLLPHVAGLPFVLAVEKFSGDGSLSHSSTALSEYLFGLHHRSRADAAATWSPKRIRRA